MSKLEKENLYLREICVNCLPQESCEKKENLSPKKLKFNNKLQNSLNSTIKGKSAESSFTSIVSENGGEPNDLICVVV